MKLIIKTSAKQLLTPVLKEQRPAPFVEHPGHSLLSAKSKQNEMDKQIVLGTNSSYQYDFLKVAFLNRSVKGAMDQLLLTSTLFIVFSQQEVNKNKIFK